MDNLPTIQKFSAPSKIFTREQSLADEIYSASGKRIRFPLLMKFIKTKGEQFVRQTFSELTKDRLVDDWVSLFLYRMKQTKIELKDIP